MKQCPNRGHSQGGRLDTFQVSGPRFLIAPSQRLEIRSQVDLECGVEVVQADHNRTGCFQSYKRWRADSVLRRRLLAVSIGATDESILRQIDMVCHGDSSISNESILTSF